LAARLGPAGGSGRLLRHAFLVVDSAQHPIIQLQQGKRRKEIKNDFLITPIPPNLSIQQKGRTNYTIFLTMK
jgi:hypothetical protein